MVLLCTTYICWHMLALSTPNVLMTIQNHTCAGNGKYMAC